ncbi:MAG: hypothetical protein H7Y88_13190 [Phycisphaerales bacterium]|nr:hypothetical protein [Phycisphaerales bacterium]
MSGSYQSLNLRDPGAVIDAFTRGARANREAACRRGSIDVAEAPGRLIASGDLHDNPLHLARLVGAAGLDGSSDGDADSPAHLTLHEIIHGELLINGMDFSYRQLARIAALKADFPEHVHALLANHELSHISGAGIVKDGVRVVDLFNEAVVSTFGDDAAAVLGAIGGFIRSMPLALRCETGSGCAAILCAHSLPDPALMDRFDAGVLERELTEDDYIPRRGAAHLMTWGRAHRPAQLLELGAAWGVGLFILGHERADRGLLVVPPNTVVLNSDHEAGVYLPVDLASPPTPDQAVAQVVPLAVA